jgi:tetratricopeptide (TPR) repeat protein
MPLAIELAAARVRFLSVGEIADRLSDAFRILSGGARTALPRQQTLHATIEWSYELLSPEEQAVFCRLGVFRGGFDLAAAEATVHGDPVDGWAVFELLSELVSKSMVQVDGAGKRFRLLETLRQYALEQLQSEGESDQWRRRHAEYFTHCADEAYDALRDHRQAEWFDRLDTDHENYRAAIGWAIEAGETTLAARMARGIWWYWFARNEVVFGRATLTALIERGDQEHEMQTQLVHARAWTAIFERVEDGLEDAEAAAAMAASIADDRLKARTMVALVPVLGVLGRADEEQRVFEEAYAAGGRSGDDWVQGRLALNHGYALEFRASSDDDPILDAADEWSMAAIRHYRAAGVQLGLAHATASRAHRQAFGVDRSRLRSSQPGETPRTDAALALYEEARNLFVRLGDHRQAAFCDLSSARVLVALDRLEEAASAATRGTAALQRVGYALPYGSTIEGAIFAALGEVDATRAALRLALSGPGDEPIHVQVALAILLSWLADRDGRTAERARLIAAVGRVPNDEVQLGLLTGIMRSLLGDAGEVLGAPRDDGVGGPSGGESVLDAIAATAGPILGGTEGNSL